MGRRVHVPREPVALAYWLLGWEKRHGHLPCGQGAAGCYDCHSGWARAETEHYPGPADPVIAAAIDLVLGWYADPGAAVIVFEPALVP